MYGERERVSPIQEGTWRINMNLLKILCWDLNLETSYQALLIASLPTHQSLLVIFVDMVYSGNICFRDLDG